MNVLRNRNFFLLWQGQLISQLGNQAFIIAASFLTLSSTSSASHVALILTASALPLVIASPIGGAVADRHSRRTIVVMTDLIRGMVMTVIGLIILFRPVETTLHITTLVAGAAVNGVMAALFGPALHALVPEVVSRQQLPAANALSQISNQASVMIGQAASGVLYVAFGPALLLIANGMSFGYAALSTSLTPRDTVQPGPKRRISESLREYALSVREGLSYLRLQRGMTTLLVSFAAVNMAFMPVFVLLPFYVRDILQRGPEWYGFLLGASGGGALIGSMSAPTTLRAFGRADVLAALSVGGLGFAVLVLAHTTHSGIALAAFGTVGVLSSTINVVIVSTFQGQAAPAMRGRVMALVMGLSSAAVPVGMIAGGFIGDAWRESLQLVFSACGTAIGIVALVLARNRALRFDDSAAPS
jgi:MFS transporter, DHA3 family, macrolide efflux protein